MKKIIKWTGIVLGGLIGLIFLAGLALYPIGMKKLTRLYPNIAVETVNIPTDVDAITRGKHIATIWSCTKCHGENLDGILLTNDPFLGTISASNLTSGGGGVGGAYTNADWVRAIRHGVKPDGHIEAFMYNYSILSDQDLGDLIAYLKQLPPMASNLPATHFGWITPIAPAVGWLTPAAELIDHNAPHPADPAPSATTEYGKYLFTICAECHSTRLASDLEAWNKDDFVRAVRTGILPNGKQLPAAMSSKTFGELNDAEMTALWLYLKGVNP